MEIDTVLDSDWTEIKETIEYLQDKLFLAARIPKHYGGNNKELVNIEVLKRLLKKQGGTG